MGRWSDDDPRWVGVGAILAFLWSLTLWGIIIHSALWIKGL